MIKLKINNQDINIIIKDFPDGTPKINFDDFDISNNNNISLVWKFDNMNELFVLYSVKKSLDYIFREKNENIFSLYMPYIPNARMDRIKAKTEVFTLKYFCDIINQMKFNNVYVINAHSDVSLALLNNCEDLLKHTIMKNLLEIADFDTIMYPDLGACKRYSNLLSGKYGVVVGNKNRDWNTGEIKGYDIIGDENNIKDKTVLIIDDISSMGTTFFYAGLRLKDLGAKKVLLYVTHCENTILNGKLVTDDSPVDHIYTTDSIFRDNHPKITVLREF
jgi:ribose-phosphate pyrophosphokinase